QENKEEHTLPTPQGSPQFESTPTVALVSEQVVVRKPPGELKDQRVAEVRPNPEITKIEAEKEITPHLEVEHSIDEQHSSPHAESQAEHVM
ncbi:hypothetical protein A2U01_0080571, partial [Trifolium medium]|nr:hypothetical protein [Trifolium medium]